MLTPIGTQENSSPNNPPVIIAQIRNITKRISHSLITFNHFSNPRIIIAYISSKNVLVELREDDRKLYLRGCAHAVFKAGEAVMEAHPEKVGKIAHMFLSKLL